jgi:serine/threonine protein kinase
LQPGATLGALVDTAGKLPVPVSVAIFRQILQTLAYLHDPSFMNGGLVHGNLSPENVLVGTDGSVRLCGFTSAVALAGGVSQGDVRSDARFTSPEVLRGEPSDGRADVFAVGALLRSFTAIAQNDPRADYLSQIMSSALESEPASRYPSAARMLADLAKLPNIFAPGELGQWVQQARPTTGQGAAGLSHPGDLAIAPRSSRRKLARAALFVLVASLVIGFTLFVMQHFGYTIRTDYLDWLTR